jgi:hypothetical protein
LGAVAKHAFSTRVPKGDGALHIAHHHGVAHRLNELIQVYSWIHRDSYAIVAQKQTAQPVRGVSPQLADAPSLNITNQLACDVADCKFAEKGM